MPIQLSSLIPSGGSVEDNREFKNWQDWVGDCNDSHSNIGQATRVVLGQTVNRRPGGSATFTVPSGVSKVRVTCIGAGGGGGNYNNHYYGGKGGGGGCFASGEYDVTPGEVLNITVGAGGGGHKSGGYGGNGGSSSVTDNATGGSNIAVSAGGGSGGYYQSTGGDGASSHSVSGNKLISGSTVGGHGGNAGNGSSYAFGFGPEGYGSGGGGAAGSFLGNGGQGGSGHNGGYTYSAGGGGGIGGSGGRGYGSEVNSAPNQYQDHAGAGGGSAGNGDGSTYNNGSYRAKGGAARYDVTQTSDFDDGTTMSAGQMPMRYDRFQELMERSHGARHGDGETNVYQLRDPQASSSNTTDRTGSTYIQRGVGGTGSLGQYDQFAAAPSSGEESTAPGTGTAQKSFNGVLGRLWGGGGGGAPCHDENYGYYNHSGGDGGSGAGGGGGAGATTSWNSGQRNHSVYASWDWTNLAFRVNDSAWNDNGFRINGHGGNGGALGGGGGSAAYAPGGAGGIGGGGGGGGGHYSGGSYYGTGGPGGPGYVLIEW